MKQITPTQHLAISLKPFLVKIWNGSTEEMPRFTKPGENQSAAIKRLMTTLKRKTNREELRQFPKDSVSLFSTKNYVESYYRLNALGTPPYTNMNSIPTTWPDGPEVEFSEVNDDISDLI